MPNFESVRGFLSLLLLVTSHTLLADDAGIVAELPAASIVEVNAFAQGAALGGETGERRYLNSEDLAPSRSGVNRKPGFSEVVVAGTEAAINERVFTGTANQPE